MTDDQRLFEASIKGDTSAFEELVRKYQSLVCAITFGGTARIETSEELAQEVFLRAWQNRNQLKEPEKFRPWLCSIARNLVRNHLRQKKITPVAQVDQLPLVDKTPTPSEQAVSREETMILEQALGRIPDDYREPLVLYYRQEQSIKEVSEQLDLNEATVRTRLHRGRQMLKEQTAAIVERTLEKTAPDTAFTKTVMAGIGAGLAAGAATTATAAAATVAAGTTGTTLVSMLSGLLTTTVGKIIVAAAALVIAVSVVVYSYNSLSNEKETAAGSQDVSQNTATGQQEINGQNESQDTDQQQPEMDGRYDRYRTADLPVEVVEEEVPLTSSRHPEWPTVDEPVDHLYMKMSHQEWWVHLPGKFRQDDGQTILIDNAKQRIEIKTADKTVQYSKTLTAQNPPIYRNKQPLTSIEVFQYVNLFGRSLNPHADREYTVQKIGQDHDGAVEIYSMQSQALINSNYEATAYVDTATRLPEEIVAVNIDPNSPMIGQVMEKIVFDFSPIPDSMFEYTPGDGQTVLPFKQEPGFQGQVVDTAGAPVSEADIFVYYRSSSNIKYLTGKSDANGNFKIKLPPEPGREPASLPIHYWAIKPEEPNYVAWTIYEAYDGLKEYVLGYGGDIIQSDPCEMARRKAENGKYYLVLSNFQRNPVFSNILLVMEPAGTIDGYVTDVSGHVIANAKLSANFEAVDVYGSPSHFESSSLNWKFETVTDPNGYYQIETLPALWKGCQYSIDVSAEGFVSECKRFKTDKPLDNKEFNIALEPQQVTISGLLKDNYGTPLANRSISLSAKKMSLTQCNAETDSNGRFVIEGCPDVPGMTITSNLKRRPPNQYPSITKEEKDAFLFYPDVSKEIPYVAGQKEYFVELTAIRPETTLEVYVTDSAGNPIPEMVLKLEDLDGGGYPISIPITWTLVKLEKRTDETGRVFFDNIIPDVKKLTVCIRAGLMTSWEISCLYGQDEQRRKECRRLERISSAYEAKYQRMGIPFELIEGQTDHSVHVVALTKAEFEALSEVSP